MNHGTYLRAHIEAHLGVTPSAVHVDSGSDVTVASFYDVPEPGLDTRVTIGLSGHALQQSVTRTSLRQELLTCTVARYRNLPWHEVLMSGAMILLSRHVPFMLGEVIGPAGPLFPEAEWCKATALLCAPPAYFDADFSELHFEDNTAMVFVELIPITTAEASWVHDNGWSLFFDRVNSGEIDIENLSR